MMGKMPKKAFRLRRPRKMNMGAASSPKSKEETIRSSQERKVRNHPRFPVILAALREGISCQEVANWFAIEGWIDVNERTFSQYLQVFKRRNPAILDDGAPADTIDELIAANRPNIDPMTELNRLLRLQKRRLGVDVNSELNIGKLFNTTHKEVEVARNLLETMAKIQGKIGGGDTGILSKENTENIRELKNDEGQRDRLAGLADQLVGVLSDGVKKPGSEEEPKNKIKTTN